MTRAKSEAMMEAMAAKSEAMEAMMEEMGDIQDVLGEKAEAIMESPYVNFKLRIMYVL